MTKYQVLSFKFRILVKYSLVLKSFKFIIGKIYWKKKVLNFSLVGTNFWHSEWKPLQIRRTWSEAYADDERIAEENVINSVVYPFSNFKLSTRNFRI